ncbi:hypothetical protein BU25DRAFT_414101 [Macroventuria anomochaeta]|uniref:Uncharacterized protein n=1 Tax=Macroventuria anomochaeta TaxID=301207 RepID=A0ACB6RNN0_9PLEO|nr:uncharacterized protein BU25DRAFT_414101 [Macroventuria anomochaeta]KAF2623631.1 hypothetical protein BU25DRAFT_414101 [Macroventuria anomochaeta]
MLVPQPHHRGSFLSVPQPALFWARGIKRSGRGLLLLTTAALLVKTILLRYAACLLLSNDQLLSTTFGSLERSAFQTSGASPQWPNVIL